MVEVGFFVVIAVGRSLSEWVGRFAAEIMSGFDRGLLWTRSRGEGSGVESMAM